jgi:dipeptidase E
MRLLLISNSTNPGEEYLKYPSGNIRNFLGTARVRALFIPYAAVTFSFDDYEKKVSERFTELGYEIVSIHKKSNLAEAVKEAEAIVVGGGNTWQLLKSLRDNDLIEVIREKVYGGTPYIGWSAGSNVACPTIKTTNDMPITEPDSFNAFGLVQFQINPHYTDFNPPGHAGETREQRIVEFIEVNPDVFVAGLREGSMLICEGESLKLLGDKPVRIFRKGQPPRELGPGDDLSFLLNKI